MTYVGEAGDALSSTHTMIANAVVRERSRRGDYFVIRTVLTMDVWELGLTGIPAFDGARAGLRLRGTLPIERFNQSCAVRVMVNGEILGELEREDFRLVNPTSREVFVVLAFDQLVQMAQGERVSVRVCDEELRLGPEHRAVFAEFALRMEEERRWLDAPEGVQDLTAVPAPDDAPSETAPGPAE